MSTRSSVLLILLFLAGKSLSQSNVEPEIELEEDAETLHRISSINLLVFMVLLVLTVLTYWALKRYQVRIVHETGLAFGYGMIVGAIIRFSGKKVPYNPAKFNLTLDELVIPHTVWISMFEKSNNFSYEVGKYIYQYQGIVHAVESQQSEELEEKATFDPEVFFNILLPPIIFFAGYSMKRGHFFRNLGAILAYAFIGTTISCIVVGCILYGFVQLMPWNVAADGEVYFGFKNCLLFGALISATDPVTVLAIFSDLNVDVDMYAMVFGESVMNDAVAIILTSTIEKYQSEVFDASAFFSAVGSFIGVFLGSFALGSAVGIINALITKFTYIGKRPLLETALFCLLSYSTFLLAESLGFTGIVSMLFCGMMQAHYTYNNLSEESQRRTKEVFELVNFLAENFIFCYMGIAMFTFQDHSWKWDFVSAAILAIAVGRVLNIYPISFLLNLARKRKISFNFQNMLVFAGLRGAVAFALAIRNTDDLTRQTMFSTTIIIVLITVVFCGGFTTQMLAWLKIRVGVDDEDDMMTTGFHPLDAESEDEERKRGANKLEQALLFRIWYNFDTNYVKPFLTHGGADLHETLPPCCGPVANCFTSKQEENSEESQVTPDSDNDITLNEIDVNNSISSLETPGNIQINLTNNMMPQENFAMGDHELVIKLPNDENKEEEV